MTERLYEQDSYCRVFKAIVQTCDYDDGIYNIVLNQTAFFPEGGGQSADKGTINGIEVIDVQCDGDIIIHKTHSSLPIGAEIIGEIDWELRFSRMQSHAGEHIVSGIVFSKFGYSNIGFHMSDMSMTVDFNGPLSQEDIEVVEKTANHAIYQNLSIYATYPSEEELSEIQYRSKIDIKEGIRLITIDSIDCCACCAPHPSKTGEIGIVKIIDFHPYKGGTRVEMLAGINALNDYIELNNENKYLMRLLSSKRNNICDAVSKQNNIVNELRNENQMLSRKLAINGLDPITVNGSVYSFSENLSYDELRYCANILVENGSKNCVLFSEKDDSGYIYVVCSLQNEAKIIAQSLNNAFNGKGGGSANYAQGIISACSDEEISIFINKILNKAE